MKDTIIFNNNVIKIEKDNYIYQNSKSINFEKKEQKVDINKIVKKTKKNKINNKIIADKKKEIKDDKYSHLENREDEIYYVNYRGGNLEPEWQWAKNISVVYTWVDGSDINLIDQKAKYDNGYRNNSNRYRSVDELLYSLRSLQKYMPWHEGIIYIVTNQQKPKWLNTKHPRIKIIDHQQIIPEYIRPTYNSNIIELFLDKIPGLTERFIYFNDDFFLKNYVHPAFFFTSTNYYPKIYKNKITLNVTREEINEYIKNNINMFVTNKYNTDQLIKKYFDPNFKYYTLCHTPFSLYRDLYEPYRRLFQEEWHRESAYRFRSHYNFQVLYLYQTFVEYATQHKDFPFKFGGEGISKYFKGQALPNIRTIRNYSVKVYPGIISDKYIVYGEVTDDPSYNRKRFRKIKKKANALVFNINDEYTKNSISYQLLEFLMSQFKTPSDFEKSKYKKMEQKVQKKLMEVNLLSKEITKEISGTKIKSKLKNFEIIIEKYKISILKKYIEEKENLKSPPILSQREKKKIKSLLKYNGIQLEEKWNWARNISIVYYYNNYNNLNNLELYYSLCSIEKYLPWHNGTIYIITEKIIEKDELFFMKTNAIMSRIQIFSKDDIIPNTIYQNIKSKNNRNIIERYLDYLPGISEKFIYLQPNHLFLNYIHPKFFFSEDGSPIYYFENPLSKKEEKLKKKEDKPFYVTYNLIRKYFGKYYIETMRYLKDTPFTCYRDLFNPVRQLYKVELEEDDYNEYSQNIIFLYLLSTYNIYGTDHPYYPDFIVGFGKIKNINIKKNYLNNNRTLSHYGFDIASPLIAKTTILTLNNYSNDNIINENIQINLLFTKKLFFSLNIENQQILKYNVVKELRKFLEKLYF